MHYLLNYKTLDHKEDLSLTGTIYDLEQKIVEKIFSKGIALKADKICAPFTVILDDSKSSYKKRKLLDKVRVSVIQSGTLFLVSPKTVELFRKLEIGNVQFFDINIKGSDFELNDYKVINITDKIDCVDFEQSDLRLYDDGGIKGIEELVLDESKIPEGKQMFLLGRRETAITIIHESLRKAIEDAGLSGFGFVELEEAYEIY